MKVLLHRSHCSSVKSDGWSGAPGEGAWVRALCDRIATSCRTLAIDVTIVDGDLQDHPEFHADYDAFAAPHYDANIYGVGGCLWGRATASPTAVKDDALGAIFWKRFRAIPGAPPEHFERLNVNISDYYAFRLTSARTPGILVEHGVGAPGAPDYQWLRDNVQAIADCWALSFAEFAGISTVPTPVPTPVPTTANSVLGPSSNFTTPAGTEEWAALYRSLAPQAGVRAEVAFAQALKETNNFQFTGTAQASWNNPAGLGVTGSAGVGNVFPTKEAGVRAHLGHLLWYFGPTHPVVGFCDVDQRHFGAHKGFPDDVTQLNGKWAVPGVGYGESIIQIAQHIKTQEDIVTDDDFKSMFARLIGPDLEDEIQKRKQEAIDAAVAKVASKLSQ